MRGALGPERTDPAARCGVDSPSRSHAGTHVDLLMWVRAEEAYGPVQWIRDDRDSDGLIGGLLPRSLSGVRDHERVEHRVERRLQDRAGVEVRVGLRPREVVGDASG